MNKHPLFIGIGTSLLVVAGLMAAALLVENKGESDGTSWFAKSVGVVEIAGAIQSANPYMAQIRKYRRDGSIKAVVIRVNSPGGGVSPSQEISREVAATAKIKPVVCSMGAVAASGGYYLAAPATKIVANPGTVTGSIGVVMTVPSLKELFGKIGIKLEVLHAGKLKAAGTIDRTLSPEEKAMLMGVINDMHDQFIQTVAAGRKMPLDRVRALADGRIFSGRMAQKVGLVDRLGNFQDAVDLAARLAGIKGKPHLVWPEKPDKGFLAGLLENQTRLVVRAIREELAPAGAQYLYVPSLGK